MRSSPGHPLASLTIPGVLIVRRSSSPFVPPCSISLLEGTFLFSWIKTGLAFSRLGDQNRIGENRSAIHGVQGVLWEIFLHHTGGEEHICMNQWQLAISKNYFFGNYWYLIKQTGTRMIDPFQLRRITADQMVRFKAQDLGIPRRINPGHNRIDIFKVSIDIF